MSAFPSFVLDSPSELCFHLKIVCNCDFGPTGQVINQQNLLGIPKDCCHNCLHFKTHNKFQMHFYFYTLKINNTTVFTICINSKWWLESMVVEQHWQFLHWQGFVPCHSMKAHKKEVLCATSTHRQKFPVTLKLFPPATWIWKIL